MVNRLNGHNNSAGLNESFGILFFTPSHPLTVWFKVVAVRYWFSFSKNALVNRNSIIHLHWYSKAHICRLKLNHNIYTVKAHSVLYVLASCSRYNKKIKKITTQKRHLCTLLFKLGLIYIVNMGREIMHYTMQIPVHILLNSSLPALPYRN